VGAILTYTHEYPDPVPVGALVMWTVLFRSFPTSYRLMQQWHKITQLPWFLKGSLFCDITPRRRHAAEDNLRSYRSEILASLPVFFITYHLNNSSETAYKELLNKV
jgi:hypothetical protein